MLLHARTFTPRFTYGASHLTTCDGFITLGSSPVGSSSMLLSLPNSCNLSFPITDLSLAHLRSWRSVWPGSALHSCFRKILFSCQGAFYISASWSIQGAEKSFIIASRSFLSSWEQRGLSLNLLSISICF